MPTPRRRPRHSLPLVWQSKAPVSRGERPTACDPSANPSYQRRIALENECDAGCVIGGEAIETKVAILGAAGRAAVGAGRVAFRPRILCSVALGVEQSERRCAFFCRKSKLEDLFVSASRGCPPRSSVRGILSPSFGRARRQSPGVYMPPLVIRALIPRTRVASLSRMSVALDAPLAEKPSKLRLPSWVLLAVPSSERTALHSAPASSAAPPWARSNLSGGEISSARSRNREISSYQLLANARPARASEAFSPPRLTEQGANIRRYTPHCL